MARIVRSLSFGAVTLGPRATNAHSGIINDSSNGSVAVSSPSAHRGRRRLRELDLITTSKRVGMTRHSSLSGVLHGRLEVVLGKGKSTTGSVGRNSGNSAFEGNLHAFVVMLVTILGCGRWSGADYACTCISVKADGVLLRLSLRLNLTLTLRLRVRMGSDSPERFFRVRRPVRPSVKVIVHLDEAVDDGNATTVGARDEDGAKAVRGSKIVQVTTGRLLVLGAAADAVLGDEQVGDADEDVEKDEDGHDNGDDQVAGGRPLSLHDGACFERYN